MYRNNLFETLKELVDNQEKENRKPPMHIYKDEQGQIIEELSSSKNLTEITSVKSKQYRYKNPAKLIHKSIFRS